MPLWLHLGLQGTDFAQDFLGAFFVGPDVLVVHELLELAQPGFFAWEVKETPLV